MGWNKHVPTLLQTTMNWQRWCCRPCTVSKRHSSEGIESTQKAASVIGNRFGLLQIVSPIIRFESFVSSWWMRCLLKIDGGSFGQRICSTNNGTGLEMTPLPCSTVSPPRGTRNARHAFHSHTSIGTMDRSICRLQTTHSNAWLRALFRATIVLLPFFIKKSFPQTDLEQLSSWLHSNHVIRTQMERCGWFPWRVRIDKFGESMRIGSLPCRVLSRLEFDEFEYHAWTFVSAYPFIPRFMWEDL